MTNEEFSALADPCFVEGPQQESAIALFCAKLRPYLWIILSRLNSGNPDMAEDAIQSAFVRFIEIFKGRRKVASRSPGYFVTIAKHCLIDEARRRQKYVSLDELSPEREGVDISGWNENSDSREELLLVAMERMGPKCRFILERYYLAQVKGPQLALELGISPESIPMTVKRCRDELRHVLVTWLRAQS